MARFLTRFFDLRAGEAELVAKAFAALFLVIAAHTMLETARDALFLSKLPPAQLNVVYVVLAGVTFVAAAAGAAFARRFGRRNALVCSLVVAAYLTALLYFLTPTPSVALGLYVFSGVVGAVLLPQFWLMSAQIFTVAQARRLFGPIAAGGVLGGVAGAGLAAAVLEVTPVTRLLPIAASIFVLAALVLTTVAADESASTAPVRRTTATEGSAVIRRDPFLVRVAILVALSTAAVLTVDYFFKSTAARLVPAAHLGQFFARYYAAMNGMSLLVQLFVAGPLVRRLGVAGAVCVMPLLLLGSGGVALLAGGALIVALGAKSVDGGLRHSLNRIATELLYLPVPADARDRGKGFIDGVLGRLVQAFMGVVLYLLAVRHFDTPRALAGIIVILSAAWLGVALAMRRPYVDLFRRALTGGTLDLGAAANDLDAASAEVLVDALASPDSANVVSAMNVLAQKQHDRLIPAIILYHPDEAVLVRALGILGDSPRRDWVPLGERLLSHPREAVRIALVRALAKHGETELLRRAADDVSSAVQAYAAFYLAHRDDIGDLIEHPLIAVMMKMPGDFGVATRRALLAAVVDSREPRAAGVVLAFAADEKTFATSDMTENLARAMGAIKDPRFIPVCIARLAVRAGRDAVRSALVEIGDPALAALESAMRDPNTERRVRLHVPRTIARFDSQRAADFLTEELAIETDGLVRYKVLRGLGQLVARHHVKVDRVRIEAEAQKNLREYLRVSSQRLLLIRGPSGGTNPAVGSPAEELLVDLLADKMSQSLERVFRLLKIVYRHEDIHRVHTASQSNDRSARANAGEFLDALLARRDQVALREMLRLVIDDLDDVERVARARAFVPEAPSTYDAALRALVDDHDEAVAALAAHHALLSKDARLHAAVARAAHARPSLQSVAARFFGASQASQLVPEVSGA